MDEVQDTEEQQTPENASEVVAMHGYRCRMCRRPLFSIANITYHKQATHRHSQKGNKAKDAKPKGCSSHFLAEPMEWMSLDDVHGKINCPQCDARLGSYDWSGTQCSCGSWVTPAIQITQSRVDQIQLAVDVAEGHETGAEEEKSEQPTTEVDVNT